MSAYHGATRRQPTGMMQLLLAALFGALVTVLAALTLQRHAKPNVAEFGLVCFSSQPTDESPYRKASSGKKQEPAFVCTGAQR
jgi:hypothetical protein